MTETPPAEPERGPTEPSSRSRGDRGTTQRRTESVLFVAIGLVIGIVATIVVTQQLNGDRPARIVRVIQAPVATGRAPAAPGPAAPGPASASGTTRVPARVGRPPAKTLPPVAKPDPALIGLVHIRPAAVSIPAVHISSTLIDLGLNADGSLQVPTDYSQAGWYSNGSYPGDADGPPALIVGHVDNYKGPAVFFHLDKLKTGDKVNVKRVDGSTATFVVYRIGTYLKSKFPAGSVYEPTRRPELRIITCTGDFDEQAGSYLSNFVAYARLIPPGTGAGAQ